MFTTCGNKDGIDNAVHLCATKRGQMFVLEAALDPLHLACFNALDQAIMKCSFSWSNEYWVRSNFEGPCASRRSKWIRPDYEVDMRG